MLAIHRKNYHNNTLFISFSNGELALEKQSRTQSIEQSHLKKADFLSGLKCMTKILGDKPRFKQLIYPQNSLFTNLFTAFE